MRQHVVFVCAAATLCTALGAWFSAPVQAGTGEAAEAADFRALLAASGIAVGSLSDFVDWDGRLSESQIELLSEIGFRLAQVDNGRPPLTAQRLSADALLDPNEAGQLVEIEGATADVTLLSDVPVGPAAGPNSGVRYRIEVMLNDGGRVVVLAPRIPRAWKLQDGAAQREPVTLRGVVLGVTTVDGERRPLVLVERIQWFPAADAPSGWIWLARHGVDVALLDEVNHRTSLARPDDSREAAAFYACLEAMRRGGRAELTKLAPGAVRDGARRWQALAEDTDRSSDAESDDARWTRAAAAKVTHQAKRGLSSVWPLFRQPAHETGRIVVLEGTARRALRVVVDGAADGRNLGASADYFELDLFTSDSQNLPVICCVTELPSGFPIGDAIHEPVRVTGVFFKAWAYGRRESPPGGRVRELPERLAPPLVIAPEPEWLPKAAAVRGHGSLLGGLLFLAAVGLLWFAVACAARRDRVARKRLTRYDASLDDLAEP